MPPRISQGYKLPSGLRSLTGFYELKDFKRDGLFIRSQGMNQTWAARFENQDRLPIWQSCRIVEYKDETRCNMLASIR